MVVFRLQLRAAQRYVERLQVGAEVHGNSAVAAARAAAEELPSSQYSRICTPVLETAEYWGWAVTAALTAIAGFVAALIAQQQRAAAAEL